MRIYLVGYMYSGKTTVGKRLARQLGYCFMDTDKVFEERYKISISDFFSRYDETAFRTLEHEILLSTAEHDNCVISTGGGTPCFHNNMDFILENGLSIYLEATESTILSRKAKSKKARPILESMSDDELRFFVKEQLDERRQVYKRARLRFDAENVSIGDICEAIQSL
ncbi:MAG: shikimate kinase [Bacteroidales bacterium]|nr:shikimate kinase [Bacteroidales bacterium]